MRAVTRTVYECEVCGTTRMLATEHDTDKCRADKEYAERRRLEYQARISRTKAACIEAALNDKAVAAWADNPFVWAIEFRRLP